MRIAVSGTTGVIGSRLVPYLESKGHTITRIARRSAGAGDVLWDPDRSVEPQKLEGVQAVVHLAGENIGQRWNAGAKARILNSRKNGTRILSEALASLATPPEVLVTASAVGYYGNRGDLVLTEDSESGDGFLAEVCREWEKATQPATDRGIRVVQLRFGIVLDPEGGALNRMLPPFRMGVGGKIGSGHQYWSWISTEDVSGIIEYVIGTTALQGAVNATSPNPETNAEFTRKLTRVLQRPGIFPLPSFAARLMLGEMADELLLFSARVFPVRLIASGYQFRYPELEGALHKALSK